jgi:hypothetical protein
LSLPLVVLALHAGCGANLAAKRRSTLEASKAAAVREAELTAEFMDGIMRASPDCARMEAFVRGHYRATAKERAQLQQQNRRGRRDYARAQSEAFGSLVSPKLRAFVAASRRCRQHGGYRAAMALVHHPSAPPSCRDEPMLVPTPRDPSPPSSEGRPVVGSRISQAHRIRGSIAIEPDEPDAEAIAESSTGVVGVLHLCIDEQGRVDRITMPMSTCYPGYDAKLKREVRAWIYRPFLLDGKPTRVCTSATMMYAP